MTKQNPKTRVVALSLSLPQFAVLKELMDEDMQTNMTFFVYSLILAERNRRLNPPRSGAGRPRKILKPEDDADRAPTIPNPYTEQHELINEFQLAVCKEMRGEK